jgi:hypothetical protein
MTIGSEGWAPLTQCKNHDPAETVEPLCSMTAQYIECGSLGVVHRQGRLDLVDPNGHAATVRVREGTVRSVASFRRNGGWLSCRLQHCNHCVSQKPTE